MQPHATIQESPAEVCFQFLPLEGKSLSLKVSAEKLFILGAESESKIFMPIFLAQPFTNEVDPAFMRHSEKDALMLQMASAIEKTSFEISIDLQYPIIAFISPEHLSTKMLGDFAYVAKTSGYVAETY